MAEYGPLKLKLNTPGLLRTFGSPCNLRVLKKFLHGLEKVNLQVLINPRPDYDHRIQRKNPPGPQETFGLSSQFQTYGKKRNRVCRKRNSLQKSIVPKKKSRKATRSHFKKKQTRQKATNILKGGLDETWDSAADLEPIWGHPPKWWSDPLEPSRCRRYSSSGSQHSVLPSSHSFISSHLADRPYILPIFNHGL